MSRDSSKLYPELQNTLARLMAECTQQGLNVLITDCVRTKQEQDDLYAQGRTKPGSIITQVQYPDSMHCWGLAFDFCRNVKGREYDDSDGFFGKVGAVGKSLGLLWGGDWTSFVDRPHLEQAGYTTAKLKVQYGTPDAFFATWSAVPQNGWVQRDGKWLYYRNGKPVTGWQILSWSGGTDWFYFDSSGIMLTSWQMLAWSGGTSLFFFDEKTGAMAHNETLRAIVDSNGVVAPASVG